ncbi:hypothetical protein D3C85_1815910 [compost metagenome]
MTIAELGIEQGARQHHPPLAAGATDADIGKLVIEQGCAVVALEHVKGLLGILRADQADGSHRHCLFVCID